MYDAACALSICGRPCLKPTVVKIIKQCDGRHVHFCDGARIESVVNIHFPVKQREIDKDLMRKSLASHLLDLISHVTLVRFKFKKRDPPTHQL